MLVRHPIVAGTFYPADKTACRAALAKYIPQQTDTANLPQKIVAGIVPHAGWTFSGTVAGQVFAAIAQQSLSQPPPEVFVLFGAMHRAIGQLGLMFNEGAWRTPLGDALIDDRLSQRILSAANLIEADPHAHTNEHSLEVNIPFIQYLFSQARILPIAVPPTNRAVEIGQAVGTILAAENAPAICIGSTDLTHYGPSYGFTPQGPGPEGIQWAKEVNDMKIINLIQQLQAPAIVPESVLHRNACGAGAIAATIAAARQMHAKQATLLNHTTSAEVAQHLFNQKSSDSVGYASLVLG